MSLKKILGELNALQTEYKGKAMPTDVATKFESLAGEAKAMQDEADRAKQLKSFEAFAAEVVEPALPATEAKAERGPAVAGYVSLGEAFAASAQLKSYIDNGMPLSGSAPVNLKGVRGLYVPLSRDERAAFEAKAVPTLGTGVIDPTRLSDVVKATENQKLALRDVLNISGTTSNSIEYMKRTSYTRAAAAVADGAQKPEAATVYALATSTVRTHAVWIPVTEQQLADAAQIVNLVNVDLLHDLKLYEEEQVVYGSGAGEQFSGLFNDAGVVAGRTEGSDTLLDKVRRSITDVSAAGYEPNAVAMHPVDWEGIELLKGTDDRYVWAVVTTLQGPRIWGARVVESLACEENAGNTTEERNVLVGDFTRGATLYDRQMASIAVGFNSDDFIKNKRTIRAEHRSAFAIRRAGAFRKINTVAAVA
jgi:HK97 family phage major capsid protein